MTTIIRNVTKSITAQNSFSDPITLKHGGVLTLSGTWAATVSFQRRGTDGNWVDITNNSGTAVTMTGNGTYSLDPNLFAADYRFGVKTSNFTSGTVVGVLEGN